jgi:uncharacterized protein YgiM (DUF1202 family)
VSPASTDSPMPRIPSPEEMQAKVLEGLARKQAEMAEQAKLRRKASRGWTKHEAGATKPYVEDRAAKRRAKTRAAKKSRRKNR